MSERMKKMGFRVLQWMLRWVYRLSLYVSKNASYYIDYLGERIWFQGDWELENRVEIVHDDEL